MVTYADLIQFSILIVAIVGLCYTIFHKGEKKIAAITTNNDGRCVMQ